MRRATGEANAVTSGCCSLHLLTAAALNSVECGDFANLSSAALEEEIISEAPHQAACCIEGDHYTDRLAAPYYNGRLDRS